MVNQRKEKKRTSVLGWGMSVSGKQKQMTGKVNMRIEVRQWLLWLILAAALVCMWLLVVTEQSPSPVELGDPAGTPIVDAGEAEGTKEPPIDEPENKEEPSPFPVPINRAGTEELQHLPGIGPAKAQAIIQHRMLHGLYESKDDLQEVKGIGPKTMEKLADLITIE